PRHAIESLMSPCAGVTHPSAEAASATAAAAHAPPVNRSSGLIRFPPVCDARSHSLESGLDRSNSIVSKSCDRKMDRMRRFEEGLVREPSAQHTVARFLRERRLRECFTRMTYSECYRRIADS